MATEDDVFGEPEQRSRSLQDHLIDWRKLYGDTEAEPVRWLAEPILAEGRGHALYAPAKVGKSLLALGLAAAVATGRPFLGRTRSAPVPVLYLDYEMTPEDVLDRLESFGYLDPVELERLHYAMLPDIGALDGDDAGTILVRDAIDLDVGLVIIDTTGRAVGGSENDADTYLDFYRYTGKRLKAEGIAWLRLDHAGKDVARGQRGSSAKNDDVDVVWYLEAKEATNGSEAAPYRLSATHRRMAWVPASVGLLLAEDDDLEWRLAEPEVGSPPGTARIIEELDRLGVDPATPLRATKTILREAKIAGKDVAIQAAIRYRRSESQKPKPTGWVGGDDEPF